MNHVSDVITDAPEPADITLPLIRLHAGQPFVELQVNDAAVRAASLQALLARLGETRIVWICNPLRSPLTIERVFLQAAGPEADLRVERTPAELVAMLRSALEGAPRSLLIVQQPETLDPEARDTLARIAPLLRDIQFLFSGTTAFRPIEPASPVPQRYQSNRPALAIHHEALDLEPRAAAREKLPLFLLLIVALGGTVFTAATTDKPVRVTALSATEAFVPAATAHPTETIAPAPPLDVVALRREFDDFLARQPARVSRLSPDQRDQLFNEFLSRRDRPPPVTP